LEGGQLRLVTVIGKWNILELEESKEFMVTDGEKAFHNREEEPAVRLAELLDKRDKMLDEIF
jgi:hypothetical protein